MRRAGWLSRELIEADYSPQSIEKLNEYIIGKTTIRLTSSEAAAAERIKAQIVLLLDSQPRAVRHEVATYMFNSFIKTYY